MRWKRGHRSRNVEDRRHQSSGFGGGGAGAGSLLQLLFLLGRSRLGLTAIVLFFLFMWISGVDPLTLLVGGGGMSSPANTATRDAAEEESVEFVASRDRTYIVEHNDEGQIAALLVEAGAPAERIVGIRSTTGVPFGPAELAGEIERGEAGR